MKRWRSWLAVGERWPKGLMANVESVVKDDEASKRWYFDFFLRAAR